MIHSGKLDSKITIIKVTPGAKTLMGDFVPSVPEEIMIFASRKDLGSTEGAIENQLTDKFYTEFTIRFRALDARWKIRDNYGRMYNIEGWTLDDRRRFITIKAEAINQNATS